MNSIYLKKAIIFDMDGVITESMDEWVVEGVKLLSELNIPHAKEIVDRFVPVSSKQVSEYVVQNYRVDLSSDQMVTLWRERMKKRYQTDIKLKKNIIELLKLYKSLNCKLAVASATSVENIKAVLSRNQIIDYFDYITSISVIGVDKSRPDIFVNCSDYFNLNIKDCLVYEDNINALKVAKDAGFSVIGVYDHHSRNLFDKIKFLADATTIDYQEIIDLLKMKEGKINAE